jgi:hypothetical protein
MPSPQILVAEAAGSLIMRNISRISTFLGTTVTGLKLKLAAPGGWANLMSAATLSGLAAPEIEEAFHYLVGDSDASSKSGQVLSLQGKSVPFHAETEDVADQYVQLRNKLSDDFSIIDRAVIAAGGLDRFNAMRAAMTIPQATITAWASERKGR